MCELLSSALLRLLRDVSEVLGVQRWGPSISSTISPTSIPCSAFSRVAVGNDSILLVPRTSDPGSTRGLAGWLLSGVMSSVQWFDRDWWPHLASCWLCHYCGHRLVYILHDEASTAAWSVCNSSAEVNRGIAGTTHRGTSALTPTVATGPKLAPPKMGAGAWAWGDSLFWGYDPKEDEELEKVFVRGGEKRRVRRHGGIVGWGRISGRSVRSATAR